MDLSDARQGFQKRHGYWSDDLEALLNQDPRYFDAYDHLLQVTQKRGSLTRGEQELIALAVNVQVTHLNRQASAVHIASARAAGVPESQILETIQLAASLGTHSILIGAPILQEVLEARGEAPELHEVYPDQVRQELKERFQRDRKYWSPLWDTVLAHSPEYFEAYLGLSSIPWLHGTLEDSFRELIYIAIDVCTTHLFESGIRVHSAKALDYGATPAQIIDVMTIASCIGMQTTLLGAGLLADLPDQHSPRPPASSPEESERP